MAKIGDTESATWFGKTLKAIGDYTKAAVDFAVDHTFEIATGTVTGVVAFLAGGEALAQEPATPEIVINAYKGDDPDDAKVREIIDKYKTRQVWDSCTPLGSVKPEDLVLSIIDKNGDGKVDAEDTIEIRKRGDRGTGPDTSLTFADLNGTSLYTELNGQDFTAMANQRAEAAKKLIEAETERRNEARANIFDAYLKTQIGNRHTAIILPDSTSEGVAQFLEGHKDKVGDGWTHIFYLDDKDNIEDADEDYLLFARMDGDRPVGKKVKVAELGLGVGASFKKELVENRKHAEMEALNALEAAKKKATDRRWETLYNEMNKDGNVYRLVDSAQLDGILDALGQAGQGWTHAFIIDSDDNETANIGEKYVLAKLDGESFSGAGDSMINTGSLVKNEFDIDESNIAFAGYFRNTEGALEVPVISTGYRLNHEEDIREIAGLFHISPEGYKAIEIDIEGRKATAVRFIKDSGTPHTFEKQDVEPVQDALAEYMMPIQQEVPEASSEAGELLGLYGITRVFKDSGNSDGFVIVKYDVNRDRSFIGTEDGIRIFPSHFAHKNFDPFNQTDLQTYPLHKREEVKRDRTDTERADEFTRAGTILSTPHKKKAAVADRHTIGTSIQLQDDRWYLGTNGRISLADFFAIEIEAAKTLYRDLEDGQLLAVGGEIKVMNPWGKKEFNSFRLGTNFSFTDNDREDTDIYGRIKNPGDPVDERHKIYTDRTRGNDDREHLRLYTEFEFRDIIPQGFFRLNELNFGLFYDGIHESLTTETHSRTDTYDRTGTNPYQDPNVPIDVDNTVDTSEEERTSHIISFFPEIGMGFSDRSDPRRIQIFDLNAQGMITYINNRSRHIKTGQSDLIIESTKSEGNEDAWVCGLNLYSPGNPLPKLHPTFSASHFNSNRRGFGTIYDASLSFDLGSIHEELDGSFVQLFAGYNAIPNAPDGRRGGFVIGVPAWGPKSYTTDQAIKELSMERGVRRHNSLVRGLANRTDSNLPFLRPDGVYFTFTMGDTSEIDRDAGFAAFSNTRDNGGNFQLVPRGIIYCGELSINGPGGRPFYLFAKAEGGRLDIDGDGHREPHWGFALGAGYKLP